MRSPNELRYIREAKSLVRSFQGTPGPFARYMKVCNDYISELRAKDSIQEFFKAEQEKVFILFLGLVEEDFRANHFVSVASADFIDIFEPEFMLYMLRCQSQLKKPVKWEMMCEMACRFSSCKLQFDIDTRFEEDFLEFAIQNLSIKKLWTSSTN